MGRKLPSQTRSQPASADSDHAGSWTLPVPAASISPAACPCRTWGMSSSPFRLFPCFQVCQVPHRKCEGDGFSQRTHPRSSTYFKKQDGASPAPRPPGPARGPSPPALALFPSPPPPRPLPCSSAPGPPALALLPSPPVTGPPRAAALPTEELGVVCLQLRGLCVLCSSSRCLF